MKSHKKITSLKSLSFLLFTLVLISISLSSGVEGENVRCLERERLALLNFKQGLIDKDNRLSSWGTEDDKKECCNWDGIQCSNKTDHVIGLTLYPAAYNIKVTDVFEFGAGPSLIQLRHLKLLDLSYVDFGRRQIPEFIGALNKLQHLSLVRCNVSGLVHNDLLMNLTNLKTLDLSSNNGIEFNNLDWLLSLSSLTQLSFRDSNLSDPFSLTKILKLPFLQELDLSISEIPQITTPSIDFFINYSSNSLSNLNLGYIGLTSRAFLWLPNVSTNLVRLDLHDNYIDGPIPDIFGNLVFLEYLDLSHNNFKGEIPKSLWNLSHLETLRLSQNEITGPLPDFWPLVSLKELDLSYNKIMGSLPNFWPLVSLTILDLSYNKLTGSTPDLVPLVSLRKLQLSHNKLKELHVASLGNHSKLELLDVSYNSIQETVVEAHLSNLSNLKVLTLSFNSLSFDIKSDWIPEFQLTDLELASCQMGPDFPRWVLTQNDISILDLSRAGIQDLVPKELRNLSSYWSHFDISHNQMRGAIEHLPSKFEEDGLLFDISSNNFSGPIPIILPDVYVLHLSKNRFQGSIPYICVSTYDMLAVIDLSDNQFSGEIPDCWANMTTLESLNLANNMFSGVIPQSIGSSMWLMIISLRSNNFSGELPDNLMNNSLLRILDVGDNRIGGNIPSWIGTHLTGLRVLSLRRNEFHGNIPSNICHLAQIQILDMSKNMISGNIPDCFNNFTSMVYKSIASDNTINGGGFTHGGSYYFDYIGAVMVQWKGQESEYSKTLGLLKLIDLSSNKLTGSIPQEIFQLKSLISLDLSRNHLTGKIDSEIGQMEMLEILDLSANELFGEIPIGLGQLHSLAVLNLSNNNLSGKIPPGTQLETRDASDFAGNSGLCGRPLELCPGDGPHPFVPTHTKHIGSNEEDDSIITNEFYISMAIGFITTFWGVIVALILTASWRYAYFNFLTKMGDWLYFVRAKIKHKLKSIVQFIFS